MGFKYAMLGGPVAVMLEAETFEGAQKEALASLGFRIMGPLPEPPAPRCTCAAPAYLHDAACPMRRGGFGDPAAVFNPSTGKWEMPWANTQI
jgi:hypothetical protein